MDRVPMKRYRALVAFQRWGFRSTFNCTTLDIYKQSSEMYSECTFDVQRHFMDIRIVLSKQEGITLPHLGSNSARIC